MWATTQWRQHRSVLMMTLIVLTLTGTLALGAAAGARRAASAFDRLRDQTAAADVRIDFDRDVVTSRTRSR